MKKCTLIGAEHVLVDERIYCVNRNGNMNQTRAIQYCKELNATLPLPISLLEFEVFSNFSSPKKAWLGLSDPSKSGKKKNWRDVQNKNPTYVKQRVQNFNKISLKNLFDIFLTNQSGTRQSRVGMVQQHITI